MAGNLDGKKIALLSSSGFEDSELTKPLEAVRNAGATVEIIGDDHKITGKDGTEVQVDKALDEVQADTYDGLLLPGGVANPDHMRMNEAAVAFVRGLFDQGKPVAAICHAPWMLIEAGVVKGRKVTSWPSLKTDLKNAGADWVDESVVVDDKLITSRKPDDLGDFNAKILEVFST